MNSNRIISALAIIGSVLSTASPISASAGDTTKPSAPQVVYATQSVDKSGVPSTHRMSEITPGSATWVDLSWYQKKDDTVSYVVYRNGVELGAPAHALGPDGRIHFVMGDVPQGKEFSYQVQAVDAAGNRSVKTAPIKFCLCHVARPPAPKNPKLTRTSTGVTFSWDAVPNTSGWLDEAPMYGVFINGVRQWQPSCIITDCWAALDDGTSWDTFAAWNAPFQPGPSFTPLPTGRPLSFQVFAIDHWGNISVKTAPVTITL